MKLKSRRGLTQDSLLWLGQQDSQVHIQKGLEKAASATQALSHSFWRPLELALL